MQRGQHRVFLRHTKTTFEVKMSKQWQSHKRIGAVWVFHNNAVADKATFTVYSDWYLNYFLHLIMTYITRFSRDFTICSHFLCTWWLTARPVITFCNWGMTCMITRPVRPICYRVVQFIIERGKQNTIPMSTKHVGHAVKVVDFT